MTRPTPIQPPQTTDDVTDSRSQTMLLSPSEAAANVRDSSAATLARLESLTAMVQSEAAQPDHSRLAFSAQPEHAEEEPLESYLDKFLERLTGKKQEGSEAAPAPAATTLAAPTPEPARPVETAEPAQREPSRPPERRTQINAMRELANQNARKAVARRASRDQFVKTRFAFYCAAAISVFSSLFATVALLTSSGIASGTAVVVGVAGLVLTCRFFYLCRWLVASARVSAD